MNPANPINARPSRKPRPACVACALCTLACATAAHAQPPAPLTPQAPPPTGTTAPRAAEPTLLAAQIKPTRIPPGKAAKVSYRWQAVPLDTDYSVFVHIVGPSGATVSQDDHQPPIPTTKWTGLVTYNRTLGIPDNWPDGTYKLVVGLYTALPNKGGWKNLTLRMGKNVTLAPGTSDQYVIGTFTVDHTAPPPPLDSQGPVTLNLKGYHVTFNEDFNGPLSVSAWGPAGPGGTRWIAHKPDGLDFGDARFADPTPTFPFTITNGILRIEARKDADGWKGGMLATCDPKGNGWAQQYGYFEMRAKFPKGPGTWPAFWLLTQHHLADRKSPDVEFDIVEQYGHAPGLLFTTFHQWNPDNHLAIGNAATVSNMTQGFHRYGLLWDATNVICYFDGVELFRQPTPPGAHQPMYPLVNLALGGGWPITNTPNPSVMEVDYVRVWAKDAPPPKRTTARAQTTRLHGQR